MPIVPRRRKSCACIKRMGNARHPTVPVKRAPAVARRTVLFRASRRPAALLRGEVFPMIPIRPVVRPARRHSVILPFDLRLLPPCALRPPAPRPNALHPSGRPLRRGRSSLCRASSTAIAMRANSARITAVRAFRDACHRAGHPARFLRISRRPGPPSGHRSGPRRARVSTISIAVPAKTA